MANQFYIRYWDVSKNMKWNLNVFAKLLLVQSDSADPLWNAFLLHQSCFNMKQVWEFSQVINIRGGPLDFGGGGGGSELEQRDLQSFLKNNLYQWLLIII